MSRSLEKKLHLTGPFDAFPDELLSEIFVWWADVDEEGTWVASCVSRHWRNIVLSCSTAWSRVWVNFKPAVKQHLEDEEWCVEEEAVEVDNYREKTRPVALWLQRCGTADIYLSIKVGVDSSALAVSGLVTMLEPYFGRVREVVLAFEYPLVADVFLGMLWEHAPALAHMSIICPRVGLHGEVDEKKIMESLWRALDTAQGVKTLTLTGCQFPKSSPDYQHFALRTIVLQDVRSSIDVIVDGLAACPALEELSILRVFIDGCRPNSSLTQLVVLSTLTSLRLESTMHGILKHLRTPSLRTLDLRGLIPCDKLKYDIDADGIPLAMKEFGGELVAFIEHGTRLETVHLEHSSISDASFIRILKSTPYLRHLLLIDASTSDSLILGLIPKKVDKKPKRCPALQDITLDLCPQLTGNTLIEFVQSRRSTPFPITSLNVRHCSLVNAEHVRILRDIDPERLRVHVIPEVDC